MDAVEAIKKEIKNRLCSQPVCVKGKINCGLMRNKDCLYERSDLTNALQQAITSLEAQEELQIKIHHLETQLFLAKKEIGELKSKDIPMAFKALEALNKAGAVLPEIEEGKTYDMFVLGKIAYRKSVVPIVARLIREVEKFKKLLGYDEKEQVLAMASGKCTPYDFAIDRLKRYDKVVQENKDLKQGICEHVAQNIIDGDCKLCELAVADKGYPIWVKKAKELEQENTKLTKERNDAIESDAHRELENFSLKREVVKLKQVILEMEHEHKKSTT